MSETNWVLERPEVDHERFGVPVNKDGLFLSRSKVSSEVVHKAGEVLDALFEFQKTHDVEICGDSEHVNVFVDLKNGFTVAYENANHHRAELLDSNSRLVGYLTKT
jgi:hypothetical protein